MKKSILILSALLSAVVFADEETETPAPKYEKPSYAITMKQFPLITKKDGGTKVSTGGLGGFSSRGKTMSQQMKWTSSVRVRGTRPEKLEMEVYYIGQNANNEWVQIGSTQTETVALDDKGVWSTELLSPTTTWTESKKQKNRDLSSQSEIPEKQGERIKGCVVRLMADGNLVKSYSSDPRWKKVSEKESFDVQVLNQRKSKIGIR